jgi:hypothetical protein
MIIAVLNQSRVFASKLDTLSHIISIVNYQLRHHVAPAWAISAPHCQFVHDSALVPLGAYRLWILDDPDTAGALGYHDVDPDGQPYGRVFCAPTLDNGGTILTGPDSVSVTISHEACETALDPDVTAWSQLPSGELEALELCDRVEAISYEHNGVALSDFLLPAAFRARASDTQFDYMVQLTNARDIAPEGYRIVMNGGRVSQEFGSDKASRRFLSSKAKAHPAGRTARRLAR